MDKVSVRNAIPADAESISTIGISSWKSAYSGIIPDSYLDSLSVDQKTHQIENNIAKPNTFFLVAKYSSDDVGMICFHPTFHQSLHEAAWEIGALYVVQEYWGKRVGQALLTEAFAILKSKDVLHCDVWVLAENMRARSFYEKNGFQITDLETDINFDGKEVSEICYSIDLLGK